MADKATAYKKQFNLEKYDRIELTVKKGMKTALREAAREKGESISGYIKTALDKLYKYSAAGVREYRIVDPDEQRAIVYPFSTTKITGIFTFDDEIPVGIYKDAPEPLSICINKLMNR